MIPGNWHDWVTLHAAVLQAATFYGCVVVGGLAEARAPLSPLPLERKKRWVTNFSLSISTNLLLGLLPLTALGVSAWAEQKGIGLLNRVVWPGAVVLVVTMAVRSFASWLLHVVMHRVPALWRIHRTHHLDRVMDISTTVRFHPIEIALSTLTSWGAVLFFGLPIWALAAYAPLETAVRIFSHANVRLPETWDRLLRGVFSTPGLHRLHHSTDRREAESNYGVIFTLWDRLFGTFRSPAGRDLAGMPLGQEGEEGQPVQSFFWLLRDPFQMKRKD